MKRSAPVSKVAKHDSEIDRATENANTKATNTTRCSFREISWGHDGSLPDSEAHDKSSGQYLSIITRRGNVDDDADNPDHTQLTSSPDSACEKVNTPGMSRALLRGSKMERPTEVLTKFVTSDESDECTSNTSNLNHGCNISISTLVRASR